MFYDMESLAYVGIKACSRDALCCFRSDVKIGCQKMNFDHEGVLRFWLEHAMQMLAPN